MKKVLHVLSVALVLFGSAFSARSQATTTNFSGSLTTEKTLIRPRAIGDNPDVQNESFYTRQLAPADMEAGTDTYNYSVQALVPQVSGNYAINITSATLSSAASSDADDTFIILYAASFTPATPLVNLAAANDDINWGTGNFLSRLANVSLTAGTTYYIVVTTYESGTTGTINFSVTGPGAVNLSTLPLKWLQFTANRRGQNVELGWATATEQNTKDFAVQRSADGQHWNSIGTVAATGYSSVTQRYAFPDRLPLAGDSYYRLLQRDLDGKESFSKVALVQGTNLQVRLSPNPVVNGALTVTLESEALAELYNMAGTRVLQKRLPVGRQQLSLSHLPKGMYTFKAGKNSQTLVLQ